MSYTDQAFEGVTGGDDDAVAKRLEQEAMDVRGCMHVSMIDIFMYMQND